MNSSKDLSSSEIKDILVKQYDLGFLFNQIKDKTFRKAYYLPVIDVLRFFPQFNIEVNKIRSDLKIVILKNNHDLSKLIGKRKFQEYIAELKNIARGIDFPLSDSKKAEYIQSQINKWKKLNYPNINKVVTDIRLITFGKLPSEWQEAIENYILFNQISPIHIIYRRSIPKTQVKKDKNTGQSYIEIKIYPDTDIGVLHKHSWWKKVQKVFPDYYDPSDWDQVTIITRFIQYVLRRHLRLSQKRTLEWLEEYKLIIPDYQHASQEVSRFEKIFLSTKSK